MSDDTRLRGVVPTIRYALDHGAAVVLASHLGRPQGAPDPKSSLKPVAERLAALLALPVPLAPDCVGPETEAQVHALEPGQVLLLENLRFHPEEEANDDGFARQLAGLADVYVDDAFAAAHRAHASIAAITRYLQPAAAGLLMKRELEALTRILESPERPLVAVLGGAKVSDKIALVEHLLARVDALVIGGGMAFTFLRALGHDVGRSLVEPATTLLTALDVRTHPPTATDGPVLLAQDNFNRQVQIPAQQMGLDIGPMTVDRFAAVLKTAKTIVWNGPMGVFEKPPFAAGTVALGRAVVEAPAFSVIGGGDTVAAVNQAGVAERIGYISTAGGAFLEFLEGRKLPGVEALTEA